MISIHGPLNKNLLRIILLLGILTMLESCGKPASRTPAFTKQWISDEYQGKYDTINYRVPYLVYYPDRSTVPENGFPLLIALHGWNLRMEEWKESGLSELADRYGFILVCPQMGKANYEKEYFPQTVMKWNPEPSGKWMGLHFLPFLQHRLPVAKKRETTGILGVSTGGHGAVLVAGYFPDKFGFAASLSGDFDVTLTPNDNLSRNIFGPYSKFPTRWKKGSSISLLDRYSKTKLFLAHGAKDTVAAAEQSRLMAEALKKNGYSYIYHEDSRGEHNWTYWKRELKPAVQFFLDADE